MTIGDFYKKLTEIYPESDRASWDNDGLMCCCDLNTEVKKVLISLDATAEVLQYAKDGGFDALLVHHPLIFRPVSALVPDEAVPERVLFAVKNGISVISLHTRLDAGVNGVNEVLAELLSLSDVTSFGDADSPKLGRIGTAEDANVAELCGRIKKVLGVPYVHAYVANDKVSKVAVVGGAGADLYKEAMEAGADTLITGDVKYNCCLDARDSGINVLCAGHYFTEVPVLKTLERLAREIASAETEIFTGVPERNF